MTLNDTIKKLEDFINNKRNILPRVLCNYSMSNKGKFGLFIERVLGILNNNRSTADHPEYELKIVSVHITKNSTTYKAKDTVAIAMHQKDLSTKYFYIKNKVTLFVFVDKTKEAEGIVSIVGFRKIDLDEKTGLRKAFYNDINLIQNTIKKSSSIGTLIQSRTKGPGKTINKTRALYYKTKFLNMLIKSSDIIYC